MKLSAQRHLRLTFVGVGLDRRFPFQRRAPVRGLLPVMELDRETDPRIFGRPSGVMLRYPAVEVLGRACIVGSVGAF